MESRIQDCPGFPYIRRNNNNTLFFCAYVIQDELAMEYLKEVGPDTMIPCFSVNLKGNKSVDLCNKINNAIFQDLSHSSSEHTAHRIPMIVTSSSLIPHKHSSAASHFKKRLGVSQPVTVRGKYRRTIFVIKKWAKQIAFKIKRIKKLSLCRNELQVQGTNMSRTREYWSSRLEC